MKTTTHTSEMERAAALEAAGEHADAAQVRAWAEQDLEAMPEKSEYDQQAEHFLNRNGFKFRATLSDTKAPQWGGESKTCHTCNGSGKQKKGWPMGHPGKCGFCNGTGKKASHGHHYRVTLSKPAHRHDFYPKRHRLTFDFWSSIADAEKGIKTVKPYDVLACISGEAYTPDTFADFCAEYGYEPDSIRALQTFRRCSAFAKRLRAFFTAAELEQLQEIQ